MCGCALSFIIYVFCYLDNILFALNLIGKLLAPPASRIFLYLCMYGIIKIYLL